MVSVKINNDNLFLPITIIIQNSKEKSKTELI